jgi:TonB family protein
MVSVNESGKVEAAEVISGDPALCDASVKAAKKWTFKPFIKDGVPRRVKAPLTFDFAFSGKVFDAKIKDDKPTGSGTSSAVSVPGSLVKGKVVHQVTPVYPPEAKRKHIEGKVILAAKISKEGRIENLSPVSGPQELIAAAIGAVQQWRYQPYMINGEPVAILTTITVNFVLSH